MSVIIIYIEITVWITVYFTAVMFDLLPNNHSILQKSNNNGILIGWFSGLSANIEYSTHNHRVKLKARLLIMI